MQCLENYDGDHLILVGEWQVRAMLGPSHNEMTNTSSVWLVSSELPCVHRSVAWAVDAWLHRVGRGETTYLGCACMDRASRKSASLTL